MGFMGNYYAGPSPFAAALSQGTSGFMDAYAKMKGLGMEQQRVENEQRRTQLQEQELRDQAQSRQQQYEMSKQRLANEEVSLAHQRFVTGELKAGAERRKAKQEILAEQAKVGNRNELANPCKFLIKSLGCSLRRNSLKRRNPARECHIRNLLSAL